MSCGLSCGHGDLPICAKKNIGSQEIYATYPKDAPLNLTSYTAEAGVNDKDGVNKFTLSSGSGRITLGSSTGNIRYRFKPADLTSLEVGLEYTHYLDLTAPGGEKFRLFEGKLTYNQ